MILRVIHEARIEARDAARWYGDSVGGEFLSELDQGLAEVESHPLRWPWYMFTPKSRQFRRYRLHRFPYLIIYRVLDEIVEVVAIAHGARRPGYWHKRVE
jgi:toxin ParE1/3/4